MLKNKSASPFFEIRPAVCAAGENYVICVPTPVPVLMSVFIDGEEYVNDVCGVKISSCDVQKFVIPREALDRAKTYTITYEIIYREAYCSKKEMYSSRRPSFNGFAAYSLLYS